MLPRTSCGFEGQCCHAPHPCRHHPRHPAHKRTHAHTHGDRQTVRPSCAHAPTHGDRQTVRPSDHHVQSAGVCSEMAIETDKDAVTSKCVRELSPALFRPLRPSDWRGSNIKGVSEALHTRQTPRQPLRPSGRPLQETCPCPVGTYMQTDLCAILQHFAETAFLFFVRLFFPFAWSKRAQQCNMVQHSTAQLANQPHSLLD